MTVLQAEKVCNNQALKTMRQLIIRTEFILQNDLEDDYAYFLKSLKDDPLYHEFDQELNEDILQFGITDEEIQQTMQQLFII
ncbi:hypothetical protein [Heyndrickxia oleronia]|jgi:hypothetical protein|uniref:hypothetical protein n=1 Tax=Heyndrickxia oleronia TaxID=38875 RepID=UPI00243119D4|nr:hypothetical protein [Heyndrickxia oleronia]MCI1590406.1 hypothetical protein [Heyndrickxia oleronia]MCI1611332.1 hypothetical protein [Heyndrickxia oleronia]MCI1742775.1 hypothetical protein [Heyndrickxia oleronia]MCI1763140.1 hypothetical protein [Heyndrickxia oleronia]